MIIKRGLLALFFFEVGILTIMKYKKFLAMLLLVSSCGGGGGGAAAIPFALTIGLTLFTVNEDTTYSGSLSATANEVVTLSYAITTRSYLWSSYT